MTKFFSICAVILIVASLREKAQAQDYVFKKKQSIYKKGWIDLNKNGVKDAYENPDLPVEKRIDDLLHRMSVDEKTAQMSTLYGYGAVLTDEQPTKAWRDTTWKEGIGNIDEQLNGRKKSNLFWPPERHAKAMNNIQRFFIEQTRLGVPVDFTNEGIRGLKAYKATSFPVEIGQGSTWDTKLINQIGHVEGREARALGYTNIYAPEVDPARDPRWGRVPSTYGEDPYLISQMGVAMVKGLQDEHVVSTLKHFAVYSEPKGGRDGGARTDPHVTPREMQTIFLPPFKSAVQAGALGVMSSYNDYNGIPVTGSKHFLTQILRQQWGFGGYIVTDSGALQFIHSKHHVQPSFKGAVKQAVEAGVNIRTDFEKPSVFLDPLRELVHDGDLSMRVLNERVRQILRVKYWLGLFDHPYVNAATSNRKVRTSTAQKLSLQAAKESLVLLKNEDKTLPLDKKQIHSILVTGSNADMKTSLQGGYGPVGLKVKSVLDGVEQAVSSGTKVRYVKGPAVRDAQFPMSDVMETDLSDDEKKKIQQAVQVAKESDVAIVVVGENEKTVGESRSRISLKLPGHQRVLVKAVQQTGTPTVVVLLNGRPLAINWMNEHVAAILEAWFPGAKAGQAIAQTLFGDYNPGGKLPITFPKAVGQVPLNFPYMPASQGQSGDSPARARVAGPLYPFGYGLSYTNFQYSNLKITPGSIHTGGVVHVNVNVKNTGSRAGDDVVQLYIHQQDVPFITPVKQLRGFRRVPLGAGEQKTVHFSLHPDDLMQLNQNQQWEVMPGQFEVMIGSSSEDIRQEGEFRVVGQAVN